MGVQPTTLQAGLAAATASTDTTRPTSTITAPAAGATVTVGQPGHHHRHGHRHRRRRSAASRSRSTTAPPGTRRPAASPGPTPCTPPAQRRPLTMRSRAIDDSGHIETPRPARTVTVGGGPGRRRHLPVHHLAGHRHARGGDRPGHQRRRARREVPRLAGRLRHRHPLLQGTGTPAPTSAACGPATGDPAGHAPPSAGETASGWQQVDLREPGRGDGQHDLRRLLLRPDRALLDSPAYFATAATTRGPLTALRDGADGAQRGLPLRRRRGPSPTTAYNSEQLLGRRGVRRRPRHHQADGDRSDPGQRRDRRRHRRRTRPRPSARR